MELIWIVPFSGFAAVLFALWLAWDVLRRDTGTDEMRRIANMIFEGANAFLSRQYRTIAIMAVATSVIIGVLVGFLDNDIELGILTGVAFIVGAIASGAAGLIGMYISVRSNVRAAAAAQKSLKEAVTVSLRGGAVSGFLVTALSLLGVSGIYAFYSSVLGNEVADTPFLIVGFGFGASFVALFAQLGGGIYTKAADVGADLVGKIEAGIPEDDPRNAAVIADLVGDNVGDCAGRGADLFESMSAENIGAMILGVAIFQATGNIEWILFPLVLRSFGILATMVALIAVPFLTTGREKDAMGPLNKGYYTAVGLSAGFLAFTTYMMMDDSWVWFFGAGLVGIATGIAFVFITQYYTSGSWRPVQEIARASKTGPATNIIIGTAVGMETTALTAIAVGSALVASFLLGAESPIADQEGVGRFSAGIFGTAVATMGMLMTAAYILAMDTFGPITDNAGGINQMAGAPPEAREITDSLDAVGNTTKALTKGYAVGSAALAAFLLFSAYLNKVKEELIESGKPLADGTVITSLNQTLPIDLSTVQVFVGALMGVMLVFLFSSLTIRAVGTASGHIIEEVRRQFREHPGIMEGTEEPDYARAVDITTSAALREMIAPGMLVILMPIAVGLIFRYMPGLDPNAGWQAVAGLLMVGTIGGVILATFLNNSGGAWDNAKKFIEAGKLLDDEGNVIGKGTDTHAAAVVGDTVGDPFKDTAGPSLHVLVKLLSTITLVLAPLFIA
ncbi:MAG: sodium-translocating pyrophosphatase [Chloroflexi bacterium]|nr:sodium-translocating pyrophosphatase [Chloroflexota bacterium]